MFKRSDDPASAPVRFTFDGRQMTARAGDSVAAALLAGGVTRFRDTPVGGAPRMAYCMMGVCFDCLVRIDGIPNRQACLEPVTEGMAVERQPAPAATGGELR
ncbi:(2Fe-2S)-binding protein [Salipiger sp. P9]|uniref:(2Fe-2S)-binding protein n=1 Tax=Salipiger pentaromativorans TaxID=2943193 RepID=UPI00215844F3|nr:(2Fe-2S)-binding protein [Salipiger pentaromativorans]MCR8547487.1 (2Fe-2S)-binding protein [Salipiger pentaromativorans]